MAVWHPGVNIWNLLITVSCFYKCPERLPFSRSRDLGLSCVLNITLAKVFISTMCLENRKFLLFVVCVVLEIFIFLGT